jgi:hypothetical protein
MKKRLFYCGCLLFICFQFACSSTLQPAEDGHMMQTTEATVATPEQTTPEAFTPEPVSSTDVTPSPLYGCWSSGTGKVLRITEDQIFVSTNRFKPVTYVVENWDDGILTIHLINRPAFYYFQTYVSLGLEINRDSAPKDETYLVAHDYLTLDDVKIGRSVGVSSWVRDNCANWFPSPRKEKRPKAATNKSNPQNKQ